MNDNDLKAFQREQAQIQRDYLAMRGAGLDRLLKWLSNNEKTDAIQAENELDNPHKRSLYLQSSIAYRKVKAHLEKLTSLDESQTE